MLKSFLNCSAELLTQLGAEELLRDCDHRVQVRVGGSSAVFTSALVLHPPYSKAAVCSKYTHVFGPNNSNCLSLTAHYGKLFT